MNKVYCDICLSEMETEDKVLVSVSSEKWDESLDLCPKCAEYLKVHFGILKKRYCK